MDEQAIRKEILVGFEYSYLHDDWVHPLADVIDGVTAEQAIWRPGPEAKGIWDIVLHMAVWTENIIDRIRSGAPVRPAEGAWPAPPMVPNEAAWDAAKQRLWDSLGALRVFLETNSLAALSGSPYGLGDLFCRFIHNAYHIGQITKMRECMEAGILNA